ncbi:unnamed protein product [Calypogeia fissa]
MEETKTQPEETAVSIDEPKQQPAGTSSEQEQTAVSIDEPKQQPAETSSEQEQTRVLIGVSQSTTKGYPHPSKSSLHALEWVLEKLIHKQSKSLFKLEIVHVKVPDEDGVDEVDSIYATSADFSEAKRKDIKKCFHLLEVFVKKCKEAEVPVEAWVKVGDPKDVICSEVLRVKADMLILGSRGLGTLQRAFVGSVSLHCAKKVLCPVMMIKRKPEDTPYDASED